MPSVNVVNGKQIVVENLGPSQRVDPLPRQALRCRCGTISDLIQAILRREVARALQGLGRRLGLGGRGAAAGDRGLHLRLHRPTCSCRWPTVAERPSIGYALFIFSGIVVFNFWSEMAFRAPMLLHEYAHFIKQTIFPSDMLAVISTLRATLYTGDLGRRAC